MLFIEELVEQKKNSDVQMKSYSFDEVLKSTLEYFSGDELAAKVWISKYAVKDSHGNIYEMNPDEMHRRLATEIQRIEKKYANPLSFEAIYEVLKDFKYIVPQGGPMSGIGNKYQIASLSNCFVIGHEKLADSYGGILKIDQEQVQLMKRRGGVGHDLSHIRPKGSPVMNSALTSTGIVPFMERYSNSTREVAQDGRRGALMLSISIKHPDVESFIDAKVDTEKITGANISVKIDDEFMEAALSNNEYTQQYPVNIQNPKLTKNIKANELWNKIVHNAWKSAEPGILFWDTIIRESVPDCYADLGYRTMSTNPCGEIPLCPYDSCRLIAINLYSYVENPFSQNAYFNFDLFKKHVHISQRIMDDIIDLEIEKIDDILAKVNSDIEDAEIKRVERKLWENIKIKTLEGRRTGIGITAEGDMLAALNIQYGTENSIDFSVEIHKTLAVEAYRSSTILAQERGRFAIYDAQRETNNPFINRIKKADEQLYQDMVKYGRRNIALLTIAPTGTTSIMTQTTSGIEPVFQPFYKRRRKINPDDPNSKATQIDSIGDSWEEFNVFHHKFVKWIEINNYNFEEVKTFTDEQLNELVKKSPYFNATANSINWVNKVRMQGEIQKWVDHSISVTVNVPEETNEEMIGQIFKAAWQNGCKGVTVYREGSRDGVLISKKSDSKNKTQQFDKEIKRPRILDAEIVRFHNKGEKWIAFIGLKDGFPYEIFTGLDDEDVFPFPKQITHGKIIKTKEKNGKSRYDFQYLDKYGYEKTFGGLSHQFNKEYWNYAKLISGFLRYGMPIINVVNLVASLELDSDAINTWRSGVERALRKYIPNGTRPKHSQTCDACKSDTLVYQEGCLTCVSCGWSKCE